MTFFQYEEEGEEADDEVRLAHVTACVVSGRSSGLSRRLLR